MRMKVVRGEGGGGAQQQLGGVYLVALTNYHNNSKVNATFISDSAKISIFYFLLQNQNI